MITEDYVSFEIAKLLKEKGFPQEYDIYHSMVYNEEDYEDEYEVQRMVLETCLVKAGTLSPYPIGVPDSKCYCPTLSIAIKWLREKGFIISPIPDFRFNKLLYTNLIINTNSDSQRLASELYNTYEEACEAGIKYCLENLI